MAEEGEEKDREKRSKIEGPVCGQSLRVRLRKLVIRPGLWTVA